MGSLRIVAALTCASRCHYALERMRLALVRSAHASPIRSRIVALVVALAVMTLGAARPQTSSLGWTRLPGAEGCISPRELAEAVENRLDREVFTSVRRADVAIEGRIERGAHGGFHAVIAITGEGGRVLGTRELHSDAPDCHALDHELTLVISLMIDPDALSPEKRDPSPPAPPKPPPPAVTPTAPLAAPPPAPVSETSHMTAQAGAVFSFGLLPQPSVGIVVRQEIEPLRWPAIDLGLAFWPPRRLEVASASFGATVWLAEALLSACPLAGTQLHVYLQACAGVRAGAFGGSGFGFDANEHTVEPTFAASIEGRARRRWIGPLVIGVGAGAIAQIVRPVLCHDCAMSRSVPTADVVGRVSPIAATVDVTLGVELP